MPRVTATPLLATARDAAQALGTSEAAVRRLMASGVLPKVRIGERSVRTRWEAVRDLATNGTPSGEGT